MIRSTVPRTPKPAPIYIADPEVEKAAFGTDIMRGLSSTPKALSSKYFYDGTGSRLFRKIMDLPEYYLTRTETDIFSRSPSSSSSRRAIVVLPAPEGEERMNISPRRWRVSCSAMCAVAAGTGRKSSLS